MPPTGQPTGSMGASIPSGAEAVQRALERRNSAMGGTVPTLSQSPLKTPQEQGVPIAPTSMGSPTPSAPPMSSPPMQTSSAPSQPVAKTADEEETLLLVKAIADRLKSKSKATEQSQNYA
jgi:hypothetical protein